MTLDIAWSEAALAGLYAMHPWDGMRVDRAVIGYAQRREGRVERVGPHRRLTVGPFRVIFTVVPETDTMNVLYLYRVR
ncbi:MAG: hypothetical protein U0359_34995 [Byssovorax sp.]